MQFKRIIGQEKAKSVVLGMTKENRLAHGLLLMGGNGIGKMAFANAIAQYINCENPGETDSCGRCPACIKISKGIHPDVRFVLPIISTMSGGKKAVTDDFFHLFREKFFEDPYFSFKEWTTLLGGENKQVGIHIHEIRELKRKVTLKAFEGKYKVVIIWNAERIKREAANAMLKLLEEPPDRTVLIMTVADPTQLLTTINSRCQRLKLHRVEDQALLDYLKGDKGIEQDKARQILQLAEGSIEKAHELIKETNRSFAEMYQDWLRTCLVGNYEKIQVFVERLSKESKEFQKLYLSYAMQKLRDALLFSFNSESLAPAGPEEKEFQRRFSRFINLNGIDVLSKLLEDSLFYISRNANSQMVFLVLSMRVHSLLNGKVLI